MQLKKDSSQQKIRGAYYTPFKLANAIASLFVHNDVSRVLEPSCGDGVFIDSLADLGLLQSIELLTAIEIEPNEAMKVAERFRDNDSVHVICDDFFEYYKRNAGEKQYDLILGNPPYIRYQYLSEVQREVQAQILTDLGMKSNRLINAWVCFLVACIQMLSDTGALAFVIPAEILQVAYAEDLRLFLADHLSQITLITFNQLVFPEIEQEVLVFIGQKDGSKKGIRIIELDDIADFGLLNIEKHDYQPLEHVKEKWTKYFVSSEDFYEIQAVKNDCRFIQFSECGLINVGITTGNNNYFSIDRTTERTFDLNTVTLPLIGRSSHAYGIFFTQLDWIANVEKDKKAMLVCFPDIPFASYPEKHREYIEIGKENGCGDGYKCSIRDRWYIVPSVWSPDAFFLRRNNLYPKFVLNNCGAVSTDTMHRVKFIDTVDPKTILLSYYNSISFAFTEICGRSYGGGVLEVLPSEVGNVMLPKISNLDSKFRDELLARVDRIVRSDDDIELALDIVDRELLVNHLGIDLELCQRFRRIWKRFQQRRLTRGMKSKQDVSHRIMDIS